jgi:hypothetical protein
MSVSAAVGYIRRAEAAAYPAGQHHDKFSVVTIRDAAFGHVSLHFEGDDGAGARSVAEAINAAVARRVAVPA